MRFLLLAISMIIAGSAHADPPHLFALSMRVEVPGGDAIWVSGDGHLERISKLKARFVFSQPLKVQSKETGLVTIVRSVNLQARTNDRGVLDYVEMIQTDSALIVRRAMTAEDFLERSRGTSLLPFVKDFTELPTAMILDHRIGFPVRFEDLAANRPVWVDQNLKFDLRTIVSFDAESGRLVVGQDTMSLPYSQLAKVSRVTPLEDPLTNELIERIHQVAELRRKFSFTMSFGENENGDEVINIAMPEAAVDNVTPFRARKTCESLFQLPK